MALTYEYCGHHLRHSSCACRRSLSEGRKERAQRAEQQRAAAFALFSLLGVVAAGGVIFLVQRQRGGGVLYLLPLLCIVALMTFIGSSAADKLCMRGGFVARGPNQGMQEIS
jgi:hypothetical protein